MRKYRAAGTLSGLGVLLAAALGPTRSAEDGKGDAAARKQSQKNLKELAIGFYNYADQHKGQLPPAAVYSKDGKPLYSWRVLLLPYVGGKEVYQAFHLDEPWDSPHNKKLLDKMPKVFAAPKAGVKKGYTYYQVIVGPETAFTGKNQGPHLPATFQDGTSNTILVVEAGEAVPWAAPREVRYHPKKPLPKFGGIFPDVFHAALADGDTHTFKKGKVSETTVRRAIMPADGLPLGPDF